ncbi:hypothetical protein LTR86_005801 [Recurvomyces mirabilis]|nr:hypothetical protein LTR86_005801 [Recurvomyces mirabilis]
MLVLLEKAPRKAGEESDEGLLVVTFPEERRLVEHDVCLEVATGCPTSAPSREGVLDPEGYSQFLPTFAHSVQAGTFLEHFLFSLLQAAQEFVESEPVQDMAAKG